MSEHVYLVAIDLADATLHERIVGTAVDAARGHDGARIHLMSVVVGITPGIDARYAIRGEMQGSEAYPMQQWKRRAGEALAQVGQTMVPSRMLAGTVVKTGTVYREIVETARDLGITHVFMGAQRPTFSEYLLGPNSARVARHAECTVTVVRERGA